MSKKLQSNKILIFFSFVRRRQDSRLPAAGQHREPAPRQVRAGRHQREGGEVRDRGRLPQQPPAAGM